MESGNANRGPTTSIVAWVIVITGIPILIGMMLSMGYQMGKNNRDHEPYVDRAYTVAWQDDHWELLIHRGRDYPNVPPQSKWQERHRSNRPTGQVTGEIKK